MQERLQESVARPPKILLMDRDGTIGRKLPRGEYLAKWEDFEFLPETVQAMCELSAEGFEFIVITNQAGIALGLVDEAEVNRIHENMLAELGKLGISVLGVYVSPDHWKSGSVMRKPAPGMFHAAAADHCFQVAKVLYVGDDIRDCYAAAAAGCGMVLLADDEEVHDLPPTPYHQSVHSSLMEALETIRSHYGQGVGA